METGHIESKLDGGQDDKDDKDDKDYKSFILDDDMSFPKATIDPRLIKLQRDVTEFVTSVILKHEAEFYILITKFFPEKIENLLASTNRSVIEMIKETTVKFYNELYMNIQNKIETPKSILITEMCEFADYGAHILLDKLFRLTLDIHIDIERERLVTSNRDNYSNSILVQINLYLLSKNLLQFFAKNEGEDIPFVIVPEGELPFSVTIDKNIEI